MPNLWETKPTLWLPIVLVACLTGMMGCNRGPKMYQVSGKVRYKNGIDPHAGVAVVSFVPTKESTAEVRKAATGGIKSDGTFEMFTRVAGDGVYAGDYAVTFGFQKGPMDPTPLITAQYGSPLTTPYKITVDGNKTDLDYEVEALPGVGGPAAGAK